MNGEVVYIDDEDILCKCFIESLLQYPVKAFNNPIEAIKYIESNNIVCIFSDFKMPHLNGVQVAKRVDPSIPFYIITGDYGHISQDFPKNILEVMSKPFQIDKIKRILEKYFNHRLT